uniref:Uncharacterized protein n=1 Tax=Cyanothece sp. (strain PCC 7425 / ATCC 29141) TaxID=395961 RepID=B8HMZ8_CYAP4
MILEPEKRHCSRFGCPRKHYARGLCRLHYAKQYLRPSLNQAQQKYRQSERGQETDE